MRSSAATAESQDLSVEQLGLTPIRNARQLLDHGVTGLRRVVLDVAAAGLRAADPALAVDRLVQVDDGLLRAGDRCFDLDAVRSVVLLGAGKASLPIVEALERKLGDRISGGLVVKEGDQLNFVVVVLSDAHVKEVFLEPPRTAFNGRPATSRR